MCYADALPSRFICLIKMGFTLILIRRYFFTFFSQVHLEILDFKDRTVTEERMASKDDLDLMVNREREELKDQPDPLGPPDNRVNGDHKVSEDSC